MATSCAQPAASIAPSSTLARSDAAIRGPATSVPPTPASTPSAAPPMTPTPAAETPPTDPSLAIEPAAQREVVDKLAQKLIDAYVFPEVGQRMAAHVRERLGQGAYAKMLNARDFAQALTSDLQAISHDKHLRVRPNRRSVSRSIDTSALIELVSARQEYLADNFGFQSLQILPGNIGYVDITGWYGADSARDHVNLVMTFLRHADAIIVDERHNHGGDPKGVAQFLSYFMPGNTLLHTFMFRSGDSIVQEESRTLASIPGERLLNVPLFVLTSGETFSGGEDFAYNLQAFKRATLVGETTGGGANPVDRVNLPHEFHAALPSGRPVSAITGTNWEGVGVKPDVASTAASALDVALPLAKQAALQHRQQRVESLRPALAALADVLQSPSKDQNASMQARVERELKKALAAGWFDEVTLSRLAVLARSEQKNALALAILHFCERRFAKSAEIHVELARAYVQAGQIQRARASYRRALQLEPMHLAAQEEAQALAVPSTAPPGKAAARSMSERPK